MKLEYKNGAIGSTLTWIVATFVIIFILAIYFVFLSGIYVKNSSQNQKITLNYADTQISAVMALIDFLESDAGNGKSIYDLLKKTGDEDGKESERETLFEVKADGFLKKYYSLDSSRIVVSKILDGDEENIYSAYYDAAPSTGEMLDTFRDSIDISLAIPGDKKINLMVSVR